MCRLLVLLPGMDGTGDLFSAFIAALPDTFEAIVVRYPTQQFLSYAELESLVHTACSSAEPFLLIAESFSTPLALNYAATNPANLKGVVLCAGFATSPLRGWRRLLASWLAPILFYIPITNFAVRNWLVGAGASANLLSAVRTAVSAVPPSVLSARLRATLTCDARAAASHIRVPVLYIQAEQDRLVSPSCIEELKRMNPQIAVVTLKGQHLLLQREPQQAVDAVMKFLASDIGND